MKIGGALSELDNLLKADDIPCYYKPSIKAVMDTIALEQEPRWIPTSERQPEENDNYLAFYRSSDGTATLEFMMVDHCNAGGGWLHEESGRKPYKKVIA